MIRIFIVCIFASLAVGCASADPCCYPPRAGEPSQDIVVFDNHWHTGIMLPFAELPASLQSQLSPFQDCRYVAIGWGDGEFFRTPNAKVGPAIVFRAMFASRGSVLLVMGFSDRPEDIFFSDVDIYRIPVRPPAIDRIANAIDATFTRHDNTVIDAGPGPYDISRFFQANGRYSLFHTCNQWTADLLHAGGLPITPIYASTAMNVGFQLRQLPGVRLNGRSVCRRDRPKVSPRILYGGR